MIETQPFEKINLSDVEVGMRIIQSRYANGDLNHQARDLKGDEEVGTVLTVDLVLDPDDFSSTTKITTDVGTSHSLSYMTIPVWKVNRP